MNNIIESYLKNKKIRFDITPDIRGNFYELYLGSESGFIQVEHDDDTSDDDSVFFQFFSKVGDDGNSLIHSQISTEDDEFDLESEIEMLIGGIKNLNKVIAKIENHITSIKAICEENEMNVNDFIEVIYDFNN